MTNIDWSTAEIDTGQKWIDGKAIFRKTIQTGTLPNGPVLDVKNVPHNITGIDTVIDIYGTAGPSGGVLLARPKLENNSIGNIDIFLDSTNVVFSTSTDYSAFTVSQVSALYTKT